MDFSERIQLCVKTGRKIGVLSRLRKIISAKAKLTIYVSFVLAHFDYCSAVWHFCKKSDQRELETMNEWGEGGGGVIKRCLLWLECSLCRSQSLGKRNLQHCLTKKLHWYSPLPLWCARVKKDLTPQTVQNIFRQAQLTHNYNVKNNDLSSQRCSSMRHRKNSVRY